MTISAPSSELQIKDEDGAIGLFTTDNETCGDADAVCVMAVLDDAATGGVYITPTAARRLIAFLEGALRVAS